MTLGSFLARAGIIWGSFWVLGLVWELVGIVLGSCCDPCGITLGQCGSVLVSCWDLFGINSGSFWDHIGSCWYRVGIMFGLLWDHLGAVSKGFGEKCVDPDKLF